MKLTLYINQKYITEEQLCDNEIKARKRLLSYILDHNKKTAVTVAEIRKSKPCGEIVSIEAIDSHFFSAPILLKKKTRK